MADPLIEAERRGFLAARERIAALVRAVPAAAERNVRLKDPHDFHVVTSEGLLALADAIEAIEPEAP